jgi:hypothetical protein
MKGIHARPVPIIVRGDLEQGIDTSTVRVDSQYLSLDTRYPWQTISDGPDLEVRMADGLWVRKVQRAMAHCAPPVPGHPLPLANYQ